MTPEERARHLLDAGSHMTIATVDPEGTPWVTPVFYVPDVDNALYWVSDNEARHSVNVRANQAVAIVIYQTQPTTDAVYITARAFELDDRREILHAIEVLSRKDQPPQWVVGEAADVEGASAWRIYRASPEHIDVRALTQKNGKAVVIRHPTNLARAVVPDA